MTRPTPRQVDIARTVKALMLAGIAVARVEILPDRVVIHTNGGTFAPEDLRL